MKVIGTVGRKEVNLCFDIGCLVTEGIPTEQEDLVFCTNTAGITEHAMFLGKGCKSVRNNTS